MTNQSISNPQRIGLYIFTIIFGFILFILPNLFFGVTKINGGLTGINLAITGIFQCVTVVALIHFSLRKVGMDFRSIGLYSQNWMRDSLIGLSIAIIRALIDFGWVVPNTGGAQRPDIAEVINLLDGSWVGLISLIVLGVVGGGIAEEIYNRGYFITVLKDLYKNPKIGLWAASILSIVFFSVGHLPANFLEWMDILVPSTIYVVLFVMTGRLTASMVAHGAWNLLAILCVDYFYGM